MLKPKILIKVLYSNSKNWETGTLNPKYKGILLHGKLGMVLQRLFCHVTDVIDNQQCPSYLAYVFNVWESKAQRNTKRCWNYAILPTQFGYELQRVSQNIQRRFLYYWWLSFCVKLLFWYWLVNNIMLGITLRDYHYGRAYATASAGLMLLLLLGYA